MARPSIDGDRSRSSQKRKQAPGAPISASMASSSLNGDGSRSGNNLKQVSGAAEKNPNKEAKMQSEDPVSEVEEKEEEDEEEEGEKEDDDDEEEEEVGRELGPLNGKGSLLRMETDILDCPICYGALHPPIHQCPNGHVVCSSCCVFLTGKCPSCSQYMGLIRCLALENVIESINIRCINARYGCDATLSYLHRADHQKSCIYTPCSCPVSSCSFQGSITSLSQHFIDNHENSAIKFSYGCCFCVVIEKPAFMILMSPDNLLFLLFVNNDVSGGTTFSVICICPATEDHKFVYELSVAYLATDLKLKSSVEMTSKWKGDYPEVFLFVPDAICSRKLTVSIHKVNRRPRSADGNHV